MAIINTTVNVTAGQSSSGDVLIAPGGFQVFSGGSIANNVATDGGFTAIASGGVASATTLQGGIQLVNGTAIDTLIASGGIEATYDGGVTSGAEVFTSGLEEVGGGTSGLAIGMTVNGGSAKILTSGTASGTDVINGGVLTVSSGGTDKGATVGPGGTLNVLSGGTDSGSKVTGGTLNVSSGGTDSGTSVTGGTMNVSSGGTADATSVGSGGTMNVSSGGTASGASVGSGGTLTVSAGGVVSALTINDPNDQNLTAVVNVLSGGTVDGSTKIDGGQLILDAGATFEPNAKLTIINTGELVLEQDLVQRHHSWLRRPGLYGLDQDQIHRPGAGRDDGDLYANQRGWRPASGRTRKPRRQPSLGRHLHDGQLRFAERWYARDDGCFCSQCCAGGAWVADIIRRRSCYGAE